MCHDSKEPIFVTKNGYGEMVVMSMEIYEEQIRICVINLQKLKAVLKKVSRCISLRMAMDRWCCSVWKRTPS